MGGCDTIGQQAYDGDQSNEEYGPPETGVPGFNGRISTFDEHGLTINDQTTAEGILEDNEGYPASSAYETMDMAGTAGTYPDNHPWPNGVADDSQSDFAVEVTADVVIPAGDWSIGLGTDDGGKIVIPGVVFEDWQNNDSLEDDEIRFEGIRAHAWTVGSFSLEEDLETTVTAQMFECDGGDSFEIAVLDEGVIEDPSPDFGWELLGDGVFDWSVTTTITPLVSADLSAEVTGGVPWELM